MEKEKNVKVKGKDAVATRGRIFKGSVIKKFPHRIVVELERTVRIQKYERFSKRRTKIHARIPEGMEVREGDLVRVRECRPLSKIVNFVVIEVLGEKNESN